jgi:hypothetical protein
MRTSYAVVWRNDGGAVQAGKLEIRDDGLRLDGAGDVQELPFSELSTIRVGRAPDERLDGRRAIVVERRDGKSVRIATIAEVGSLLELAERIGGFHLGGEPIVTRLLVVVSLRRGSRAAVRELLEHGPPFDPEASVLERHEVFLTDREALFLFETDAGTSVVERLLTEPRLWKAAAGWRKHLAGPPRVAEVVYSWQRGRPPVNGAAASR